MGGAHHGDAAPMPVEDGIALLIERTVRAVTAETVPLGRAAGRVLAEDVAAPLTLPPHDNSAVDGYAVHFDDLAPAAATRLPVTARLPAGTVLAEAPGRGQAVRIFTGAAMPPGGPDTVVMQEDCRVEDGVVLIPPGVVQRGANRRPAGEDVRAGAIALRQGVRLRPQEIGLAAAMGLAILPVFRPLRVALFSTGDELREPGAPLPPGCIHDANRHAVAAALEALGCAVTDLGILADRPEPLRAALAGAAPGHDLIVTSGGVSVGEEDHVKGAVRALGALHLWRLAIKPGKPIAVGQVGETPFLGLPGNPVAALVTFLVVARPLVLKLSGRADLEPPAQPVRAGFAWKRKPGRREFLRARLTPAPDLGLPEATVHPTQGSAILSSMVNADGLLDIPSAAGPVAVGDVLRFLPFAALLA